MFLSLILCGITSGIVVTFFSSLAVFAFLKEKNVAPLLDEQLNELIVTFKEEIPMAGMFLKGKMVERLKKRAEQKLLGILPKVRSKIKKKFIFISACGIFIGFLIGILFSITYYYPAP